MAKKSTGIAREIDELGRVKVPVTMGRLPIIGRSLPTIPLPSRVSINKAGELALEEEQRTGRVDLYNPNIVDISLWEGYMEDVPYACVKINGKPMEFFAISTKAMKQSNYEDHCLDGFYSKQGNNFRMLPESSDIIWLTNRWYKYNSLGFVNDLYFDTVYTMEQWGRNGGFKGRAEGQEISCEVYNRLLQENQPTQPLPGQIKMTIYDIKTKKTVLAMAEELYGDRDYYFHSFYNEHRSIWDTSAWEGFMAVKPCAYARVNGRRRKFYMTFSKRKGETGAFCYRFEGLYSKEGYDFFLLGQAAEEELVQERVRVTEEASCKRYCFDGSLKIDVSASGEKISQEISEEEYDRFLHKYDAQPLPRRLPKDRGGEVNLEVEEKYGEYELLWSISISNIIVFLDISLWEGFMTTEPCAYAEVNGEQRPFYLMFTKRKDKYRGYYCRFEGVYSAQGDNIFYIPADKQNWVSTEHILWRKYIAPLSFDESDFDKLDSERFIDYKTIFPKEQ